MRRQNVFESWAFKFSVIMLAIFASIFIVARLQNAYAAENKGLRNTLTPKEAKTYSSDWVIDQKKLNLAKKKMKAVAPYLGMKNTTKANSRFNNPVAYQETEEILSEENAPDISSPDLPAPEKKLDDQDSFQNVEGGITDIRSTVGKSQIIQFAQPIKRISITDPSLADLILLSPTQMILNGKAAGVTSIIIWDESDQPAFFDLYVQNDTSGLLDAFRQVAPDEPINIKISDDGNVILSGTVSSTIVRDQIAKICQAYGYTLVDVAESPVPQVILELRIAEISRTVEKHFSLFYKAASWADVSIQPQFTVSPRDRNGGIGGQWDGNTLTGFTAAIFKPASRISSVLQMAETRGLLNILAEPKLVSTNGREATFDAGQSVPVPTGVDQNGNLAYEYKDVGVKVTFTPWISEKSQRVELKITPEVSEIDPSVTVQQNNGVTIFGFRKRKATTTVELENGETLMLAGLIRRLDTNTYTTPPFFGNIPIIGRLINTSVFNKGDSELVIMVTPKIIKPGVYGEVLGTAE